ncbi:MAG: hypothetical protein P8X39_08690 [Desulfofustis sp.]
MNRNSNFRYIFHGFFVFLGLACLGYLLADALVTFKEFERSVTAKGLSEREVPADVVIWHWLSSTITISLLFDFQRLRRSPFIQRTSNWSAA